MSKLGVVLFKNVMFCGIFMVVFVLCMFFRLDKKNYEKWVVIV